MGHHQIQMIKKIANLLRGSAPTLLNTEKANELINCVNALQNIQVVEGNETRVDVGQDGIIIQVRIPPKEEPPKVQVVGVPPIVVKESSLNTFEVFLEGYTQKIKYCGGEGHLVHLAEEYNSNDVNPPDIQT